MWWEGGLEGSNEKSKTKGWLAQGVGGNPKAWKLGNSWKISVPGKELQCTKNQVKAAMSTGLEC